MNGIRRCGKSYLLRTLFRNYLLADGVEEDHIIEMAFDLYDNIDFRDPKVFYPWAKEQIKNDKKYYFLLDEVQLLGEFVSVLNGLADKKNCDVYVTGSNAKFLSRDIATEFGGRPDLSSTTDITAFVLVFPPLDEDDKFCILPYFWIPEDTLELQVRRDHVPGTYETDTGAKTGSRRPSGTPMDDGQHLYPYRPGWQRKSRQRKIHRENRRCCRYYHGTRPCHLLWK